MENEATAMTDASVSRFSRLLSAMFPRMLEIARLLHQGAKALQTGFARLKANHLAAPRAAAAVRKTERQTEKVYRKAVAELFDPEHYAQALAERRRDFPLSWRR